MAKFVVPEQVETAFRSALAVRARAHAPYSHYAVGAAIKTRGSEFIAVGCNVENAAYPSGMCAEANAIGQMVSRVEDREPIEFVVVVTENPQGAAPCGQCRQMLAEFSDAQTQVYFASLEGVQRRVSLVDLLPFSFTAQDLAEAREKVSDAKQN